MKTRRSAAIPNDLSSKKVTNWAIEKKSKGMKRKQNDKSTKPKSVSTKVSEKGIKHTKDEITPTKTPKRSYKEQHALGRRSSNSVVTYNEDSPLFFDLHVTFGPNRDYLSSEPAGVLTDQESVPTQPALKRAKMEFNNKPATIAKEASAKLSRQRVSKVRAEDPVKKYVGAEQKLHKKMTVQTEKSLHSKKVQSVSKHKKEKSKSIKLSSPSEVRGVGSRREASLNAAALMNIMYANEQYTTKPSGTAKVENKPGKRLANGKTPVKKMEENFSRKSSRSVSRHNDTKDLPTSSKVTHTVKRKTKTPNKKTKSTKARASLSKRLERELGVDYQEVNKSTTAGKRVASLNAAALITAEMCDGPIVHQSPVISASEGRQVNASPPTPAVISPEEVGGCKKEKVKKSYVKPKVTSTTKTTCHSVKQKNDESTKKVIVASMNVSASPKSNSFSGNPEKVAAPTVEKTTSRKRQSSTKTANTVESASAEILTSPKRKVVRTTSTVQNTTPKQRSPTKRAVNVELRTSPKKKVIGTPDKISSPSVKPKTPPRRSNIIYASKKSVTPHVETSSTVNTSHQIKDLIHIEKSPVKPSRKKKKKDSVTTENKDQTEHSLVPVSQNDVVPSSPLSAVETYTSQQFIPLNQGGYGFEKVTRQVFRVGSDIPNGAVPPLFMGPQLPTEPSGLSYNPSQPGFFPATTGAPFQQAAACAPCLNAQGQIVLNPVMPGQYPGYGFPGFPSFFMPMYQQPMNMMTNPMTTGGQLSLPPVATSTNDNATQPVQGQQTCSNVTTALPQHFQPVVVNQAVANSHPPAFGAGVCQPQYFGFGLNPQYQTSAPCTAATESLPQPVQYTPATFPTGHVQQQSVSNPTAITQPSITHNNQPTCTTISGEPQTMPPQTQPGQFTPLHHNHYQSANPSQGPQAQSQQQLPLPHMVPLSLTVSPVSPVRPAKTSTTWSSTSSVSPVRVSGHLQLIAPKPSPPVTGTINTTVQPPKKTKRRNTSTSEGSKHVNQKRSLKLQVVTVKPLAPKLPSPIAPSVQSNASTRCVTTTTRPSLHLNVSRVPPSHAPRVPDAGDGVQTGQKSPGASSRSGRSSSGSGKAWKFSPNSISKRKRVSAKRDSNLWEWVGSPVEKYVFTESDSPPKKRFCYPKIRHTRDGMVVNVFDSVLLCSGPGPQDIPYVAKITAIYQDPESGDKMLALLWYYRPEHTEPGRQSEHVAADLYASRHRDCNPVACIEDRAYVLPGEAYARYMATSRRREQAPSARPLSARMVPLLQKELGDADYPADMTVNNTFLCRGVYDFKQKRVLKNPSFVHLLSRSPTPCIEDYPPTNLRQADIHTCTTELTSVTACTTEATPVSCVTEIIPVSCTTLAVSVTACTTDAAPGNACTTLAIPIAPCTTQMTPDTPLQGAHSPHTYPEPTSASSPLPSPVEQTPVLPSINSFTAPLSDSILDKWAQQSFGDTTEPPRTELAKPSTLHLDCLESSVSESDTSLNWGEYGEHIALSLCSTGPVVVGAQSNGKGLMQNGVGDDSRNGDSEPPQIVTL